MLKNEININKKVIIILLLINVIIIGVSTSYALFQTTIIQDDVVKLQMGNTNITTTIETYSNNVINIASGETKTLNIILTNQSSDYNILYKMYYTVESGEGLILVTDATDNSSGTMKGEKSLSLTIQNNNTSDLSIRIGTIGSLLTEEITLLEGQYELIVDTEPPVISSISDAGEGKITFTVSDTGSGVDKYCVNQSAEDTTNCTWITAVEGEQTTDVIATENGDYYVHVKDLVGNIGHSNVVTISFSISATDFITQNYGTGGLIAVNTSGTLYDGTGTIREYRYSGATVNNYIFFDTDGDGVKDTNEIWRIIGIFKKSSNWQLKLIRDTALTSEELPATYTYSGTEFKIESTETAGLAYFYWNFTSSANNTLPYSSWVNSSLQYYLNGTNGYYGTISTASQALIDKSYKYYLGNVNGQGWMGSSDTTLEAYSNERNSTACSSSRDEDSDTYNCYVWYGNKATWSGKVALLYPSDYGYSAASDYWGIDYVDEFGRYGYELTRYYTSPYPAKTSWLKSFAENMWLISPSDDMPNGVIVLDGYEISVYYPGRWQDSKVFPVLNLLSTAQIDANHQGTSSDPYVLILE